MPDHIKRRINYAIRATFNGSGPSGGDQGNFTAWNITESGDCSFGEKNKDVLERTLKELIEKLRTDDDPNFLELRFGEHNPELNSPIGIIGLNRSPEESLRWVGIITVGDLLKYSKRYLKELPRVGVKSMEKIEDYLNGIGLNLY
ncbi:hypothetical protein J4425_01475 [Candidatus Woesearchaeota archaeon]|nr:hypothetical protein [Candidatus Woesearchaeota archaeon]